MTSVSKGLHRHVRFEEQVPETAREPGISKNEKTGHPQNAYSDQVGHLIRSKSDINPIDLGHQLGGSGFLGVWCSWPHVAGYGGLPHWVISFFDSCCPFTLRVDSPVNWILCALLTSRSRIASAKLGSSMASDHRGYLLDAIVDRTVWWSSISSIKSRC